MPRRTRRLAALTFAAALTALASGCVIAPAHPYYGGGPAVMVAPPAPQVEVIGVAPGPGYFWISGFWTWGGGRHAWVPGHWEGHRPGYRWEPHAWHRDGQGWREAPGRWSPYR